jgi:hypothetical protein
MFHHDQESLHNVRTRGIREAVATYVAVLLASILDIDLATQSRLFGAHCAGGMFASGVTGYNTEAQGQHGRAEESLRLLGT